MNCCIFYLTKGQAIFSSLKWFGISLCCHTIRYFTVSLVGSGGLLRHLNDGTYGNSASPQKGYLWCHIFHLL